VAAARCAAGLVEAVGAAAIVAAPSAASAAAMARDDAKAAAVAPALAGELFDLTVAKARLDDGPVEVARFLVLGRNEPPATGADATSVLVGLDDKPGRLAEVLDAFAAAGLNVRRIASRPTVRQRGREGLRDLFFVDLDGHRAEPACRAVLDRLAAELPLLKVLGSYPRDSSNDSLRSSGEGRS
jgi:prephenate dehydratase